MKTLYDMLDVHPDDDAGKLKDAFRRAVKVSHPDLNADDPDASARFMQVMRANAILSDPELRAVYDRMLEFEHEQHQTAPAAYNIVPDAIVVVVLAVVMAGAYTLFTDLPEISVYLRKISMVQEKVVKDTAREAAIVAAVQPPAPAEAKTGGAPRDRLESAAVPVPKTGARASNGEIAVENGADDPAPVAAAGSSQPVAENTDAANGKFENAATAWPSAVAPMSNEEIVREDAAPPAPPSAAVQPLPPVDTAPGYDSSDKLVSAAASASDASKSATTNDGAVAEYAASAPSAGGETPAANVLETISSKASSDSAPLKDAQYYREQGIASYRNGDLTMAVADFDQAIQRDPNFTAAYIDRGIALYRMRKFDRAFADVAQAMRLESYHPAPTLPLPKARPN